jgi:hypothetical protein
MRKVTHTTTQVTTTPRGVLLADPAATPPSAADAALAWMNERYAVVQEGGKTLVLADTYDDVLDRHLILRSTDG